MFARSVSFAVAVAATMLMSEAASATVAVYDNQTTWAAAAGGPITNTTDDSRYQSTVDSITLDDGTTLALDTDVYVAHAGSQATGWETWSHGYTGTVYGAGAISISIDVSAVMALGFEIEPAIESPFDVTMTLNDGAVLKRTVDGKGGAAFFGWVGTGITSLTISTVSGGPGSGLGFGNFFSVLPTSPVPEPLTIALFGAGLAGMGAMRRRKKA